MKKVLLIVVLLMAICLSGFAQTGIYSGGISNKNYRKTGPVVRPEIGPDFYFERPFYYDEPLFFSIKANLGYQITHRIYVGGGFGTAIGLKKRYDYYDGTYGRSFAIPFHADFRWYWFDGPSSPFLEAQTGVSYVSSRYSDLFFLFTPSLGYDINGFDIKIGFPLYDFESMGISVSFGYNFTINK